MNCYRFTIPSYYGKGSLGWNKPAERQGYYIQAENEEIAKRKICDQIAVTPNMLSPDPGYETGRKAVYPFVG